MSLPRKVLDHYLHSGVDKVHPRPPRGEYLPPTSTQGCVGSLQDGTLNREHDAQLGTTVNEGVVIRRKTEWE